MYSNPHATYIFNMSDAELFLLKETVEVEGNISKSNKVGNLVELELPNELDRDTVPSSSTSFEMFDQVRDETEKEKRYGDCAVFTIESKQKQQGSSSFVDPVKVEDDDSGFRTPTSAEHRMNPETKQCPPAPRKRKPSLKRKTSQSSFVYSRNPPLDLSKEVDSLFPTITQHFSDDYQPTYHNTKKARKEDEE